MNYKLKIQVAPWQKALGIILAVFMSMGFSFSWALANSCQGGADCRVCAQLPHGHVSGSAAGLQNPGCPSAGQDRPCGFEAGQDPDGFRGIVSSVRPYRQAQAGIFAAVSDEYGHTLLAKAFFPQFFLPDSSGAGPVYLLNQSLRC